MHGVQTIPSNVDATAVQPRDTSDQPSTPATPAAPASPTTPSPASTQPSTPAATPSANAPAQNQQRPVSAHARIFDKILSGISGGDIKVVNPDGSVSSYAPSKSTIGKSIVAAALTGLFTPPQYRQGAYGPIRDMGAEASASFNAGKQSMEQARQQPQKLSDEMQSRKLMTLQNNSKLLQLQIASSQLKHANREQKQGDIDAYMKPFMDYNSERNANDPSTPNAFLFQSMTHDQALAAAKQHGLTETNLVQDGWKPYIDPGTHEQEYEPTYAAINPDLKDVKLTPEVAQRLSAMNSQYADIHKIVGGDVKLPVGLYVSAMHDYQALQQTQDVVNRLNKTINGAKAKDIDLAPIVKANRNALTPALYKIQQAIGAGHGAEEGENPSNVLDVIMNNAPQLLQPLGLTTGEASDKVTELTAKRAAALAAAKNTGTPKAAADDDVVDSLKTAVASLPKDQQDALLPTLNASTVTKADVDKVQTKLGEYQRSNNQLDFRKKMEAGDPATIHAAATNILDGALADIKDLASYKGNVRTALQNEVIAGAKARGLDETRWGTAALQSKVDMFKQYHSTDRNKVGSQLSSFRVFLDHTDDALQANDNWKRGSSPLLNKPLSWIAKNATDDPNWIRYKESFLPVAKEFMSFLNQNRAEHEADIKAMDGILDLSYTPLQAETALKAVAQSADKRLADLAYAYNSNLGTTMPEMLSPAAADTLKRLDSPSKALQIIQRLPKGNGQKLNAGDPAVTTFKNAAGGDVNLAREMAKQAGFTL